MFCIHSTKQHQVLFPLGKTILYWTEVLTATHGWITVDLVHGRINCVGEMESLCKKPILYIVAVNNDGTVKDLTKKYVSPATYLTQTRKLRVSQEWLDQVLDPFKATLTPEEKAENDKIEKHLMVNACFFSFSLSVFLTSHFCTDWLLRLRLGNQVVTTTDHL